MPLPLHVDTMQREWFEAQEVGEPLRSQLSSSLVAFLAFGPGKRAQLAGTGFAIGSNGRDAFVVTAKHVLTEGVLRIQRPDQQHATSALSEFLPVTRNRISVDRLKLRALWFGGDAADMCLVHHVHYADSLDLAVCLISLQDHAPAHAGIHNFAVDTAPPRVGAPVHIVSISQMAVKVDQLDPDSGHHALVLQKHMSIRVGTVTGVFPQGDGQYRWPCFSTSIPVGPGMSGGAVYLPREAGSIGVCGVVSADRSHRKAHRRFNRPGDSIIAMIWPAIGYTIPDSLPATPETKQRVLLDLLRSGEIQDVAADSQRLFIVRRGDDDYIVGRNP